MILTVSGNENPSILFSAMHGCGLIVHNRTDVLYGLVEEGMREVDKGFIPAVPVRKFLVSCHMNLDLWLS